MQRLGMLTIPGSCHPTRCLTPRWSHPLDVPSGGLWSWSYYSPCYYLGYSQMVYGYGGVWTSTGYVDQRVSTLVALQVTQYSTVQVCH